MKFSFKHSLRWSAAMAVLTLFLATIFTIVSSLILSEVFITVGIIVVFIIILIGVVFDTIGLAAAAANEVPFRAMAAEKIQGAKQAIRVCRNADRFASFCNDVIGDISGIVSGTASAIVVLKMLHQFDGGEDTLMHFALGVIFTSVVASLTVGGKALGKSVAIHFSTSIILLVGKFFYHLEHKLHIKIFSGQSNHKSKKRNHLK